MKRRLPVPARLLVISAGVFTIGLSEFMVSGILSPMSTAFDRPEPTVALLVSVFALAVVVSAPVTAAFTVRLRPRTTLIVAAVVFAATHAISAAVPVFVLVVVLRAVAGVACGAFLSVGNVAGVRMVDERSAPRAIAVMVGGLTVANVVGLPLAAWLGESFGWASPFWLVSVLSAIVALVLARTRFEQPDVAERLGEQLRTEVAVLRRPALLVALATTVFFQAAMFATFTYLQPMMVRSAGLSESATNLLLALFGVGTLIGVTLGGVVAHHGLLSNAAISFLTTIVVLGLLIALIHRPVFMYVLVFTFGVATFSICAALNGRVFALASAAPTLSSGVNIAALNLGNAAGPAVAGRFVHSVGYTVVPWLSIGFAVGGLILVGCSAVLDGRLRLHRLVHGRSSPLASGSCGRSWSARASVGSQPPSG